MDLRQVMQGIADPALLIEQALLLYHNNAEFNARVERSVQIVETKVPGGRFDPEDRDIAVLSASVSLLTTALD